MTPRDRFDPREWADLHESPDPKPEHVGFRRVMTLARDFCLRCSTPGQLWIDLGCGAGVLAAGLSAAGLRVVALDHDPEMIHAAHLRAGQLCAVARAEQLPVPDGIADGIVAVSLAGCLRELEPLLKEIRRVLKPGGTAVLTFTNRVSHLHRINRLFREPDRTFRAYSAAEIRGALSRAGLQVTKLQYCNFHVITNRRVFPSPGFSEWCEPSCPPFLAARLARNLVVTAARDTL